MSQVPIADLPEMLTYEQMAHACTVKYINPDDVFPTSKWRDLVSCAEKTKDLLPAGGMISIAAINDWLANGGVGLWSVFELHDPLLSDMNGMFEERDCTLLPTPIRERIRRIFHFSPWSALTPKERWEMVFAHDAMNTFKQRLRSCLGNLVYFGGCDGPMPGPTIHSEANRVLAEWKSVRASEAGDLRLKESRVAEHLKWQEKLNALNELILTGCLREEDEIPRLLGIVREAQAETWCANVIFPIWTNLNNPFDDQPPAPALVESVEPTPKENRASLDITKERGFRRLILEQWDAIELVHPGGADGRQVLRILKRNIEGSEKAPNLKTVRNLLCVLRNEKLIP